MSYFIMYDSPEIKPLEALKKSETMMKGYKGKYFLLCLSFIGWVLLGIITLGIGFLWIIPYIWLTQANFYENLKKNKEKGKVFENIKEGSSTEVVCPSCNNKMPADSIFCNKCGQKL